MVDLSNFDFSGGFKATKFGRHERPDKFGRGKTEDSKKKKKSKQGQGKGFQRPEVC